MVSSQDDVDTQVYGTTRNEEGEEGDEEEPLELVYPTPLPETE
jgi:hypothetical protein